MASYGRKDFIQIYRERAFVRLWWTFSLADQAMLIIGSIYLSKPIKIFFKRLNVSI